MFLISNHFEVSHTWDRVVENGIAYRRCTSRSVGPVSCIEVWNWIEEPEILDAKFVEACELMEQAHFLAIENKRRGGIIVRTIP